jgi:hypothetical protein
MVLSVNHIKDTGPQTQFHDPEKEEQSVVV